MTESEPTFESLAFLRANPDPARDERRAAYRKREHARIVQAFDEFLRVTYARPDLDPHDVYHDLLRPVCRANTEAVVQLQQKAHYGVAPESDDHQ